MQEKRYQDTLSFRLFSALNSDSFNNIVRRIVKGHIFVSQSKIFTIQNRSSPSLALT